MSCLEVVKIINIYVCEEDIVIKRMVENVINNCLHIRGLNYAFERSCYTLEELVRCMDGKESVYIINSQVELDNAKINLLKRIRKIDPQGYIILYNIQQEEIEKIFVNQLEVLDVISECKGNDLNKKLEKCLNYIDEINRSIEYRYKEKIIVENHEARYYINPKDIVYLKLLEYQTIYIQLIDDNIIVTESFSNLLKKLKNNFKLCSNICAVNIDFINKFNDKELKLIMKNKHICKVDKKSATNFKSNIV